jgi:hypothetical protein
MEGVNATMIYLIHCKNFVNTTLYSPPSTTIMKKKDEFGAEVGLRVRLF